ncbi:Inner membrane ABC transporter permease protein YnjC [Defluviimonas aquaemixtae]|uniref:Inner membrane ABC transporter permease protein YnjC n=2 Tax=Albidovulum aquaemixtae TaxID=1542388 RepID=A0A2R8BK46_9RHOB|nr:Inner membrane ABC transporter permease protein YnjC [Defluviimonas aquaemixtae]
MTSPEGRLLRLTVLCLVVTGLVLPILAGLAETTRAAFGILPAIGAETLSLDPWRRLFALPGFATSLSLTVWTGFAATLLSLVLAIGFAATLHDRFGPVTGGRLLSPFLATPHAAMAIGLAFVMAPSGWIARILSPWATGWDLPPDLATVNDPMGLALILGLAIKEVPFFLLVILAGLTQLPVRRHIAQGQALGYGRGIIWIKVIMPQLYPLIRLPVYVVLAFSLSVVDMAIILGPSNPPVLAVAVTRWFLAADTTLILPASAAALLQTAIVLAGIAAWWIAERLGVRIGLLWLRRGGRGVPAEPGLVAAGALAAGLLAIGAAALLSLLVWSLAWRWSFPAALPESWSMKAWMRPGAGWGMAFGTTVVIGASATLLSVALAIAWLEGEDRARMPRARWAEALIYLPLLVPQIAFLYGLHVTFLRAGLPAGLGAVIWGQALFVFPYVMIALSDPWRSLDPRLPRAAAALGAGPVRRLFAVKIPVLLRPVMTAAAIGFAVSVAQYLPTLFLGAGRVATLTTEAVTLSSGSDRRVTGVYAVLQAALPFAAYLAALAVPAFLHRNSRQLSGAVS